MEKKEFRTKDKDKVKVVQTQAFCIAKATVTVGISFRLHMRLKASNFCPKILPPYRPFLFSAGNFAVIWKQCVQS
jgi:hypothetical protein